MTDIENLWSLLSSLGGVGRVEDAQTIDRNEDFGVTMADSQAARSFEKFAEKMGEKFEERSQEISFEQELTRSPRFYDFPNLIDELPFLRETVPISASQSSIQEMAIAPIDLPVAKMTVSGDDDAAIHTLQDILVVPEIEDLRNFKTAVEQKLGMVESQVNSPELLNKIKGLEDIIANATSGFSSLDSKLLALGDMQSTIPEEIEQVRDRLSELERQIHNPQALVQLLLPIIAEILSLKANQSREEMCQAIMPIIAEVIFERSQLDHIAMSRAIADLLPSAIRNQINDCPEDIAKAIAPEMGAAIREQIRIDRHAVIDALAPEMGAAIKRQIELERESMVDALYPVIGNTIAKYFAEAIRTINEKIENTFSPEGIKRKVRAKLQGVSEAELILKEAVPYTVQAVFLIHNLSGLIIVDIQQSDLDTESEPIDADMLAGMLTAIRSFASECMSRDESNSELDAINYSGSKIILEVAGYCYLAVIVQGEPDAALIAKIRHIFGKIVQSYGDRFKEFNGDTNTIPPKIQQWLQPLVAKSKSQNLQKSSRNLLLWGGCILAGLTVIAIGLQQYSAQRDRRLEDHVLEALASTPELGVYRLYVQADGDRLTLSGKLPSVYLRDRALQITRDAAKGDRDSSLDLNNQIYVVNIPPEPQLVTQAVQRLTQALNHTEGIRISSQLQAGTVTIFGQVEQPQQILQITQAFSKIAGVNVVTNAIALQPAPLNIRIYFPFLSTTIPPQELDKLTEIQIFLDRYPDYHLNIWAKSDNIGDQQTNERLSWQRAQTVKNALIQKGVIAQRLHISGIISKSIMSNNSLRSPNEQTERWIEFQTTIKSR